MNKIYVFSSTGTSLQIAKDIAKQNSSMEIFSMAKLMKKGNWSIEGEKVGFIFPCYYGRVPQLVRQFINEAQIINVKYAFSVVTSGEHFGYSLKEFNELLQSRDHLLQYGRGISIASNYMNGWYYSLLNPSDVKLKKRVIAAKEVSLQITRDIAHNKQYIEKASLFNYKLPQTVSPKRYTTDTRSWDSEFSVGEECNGCGTCEKVCPVNNIQMADKRPAFSGNCQRCMGCIQFCPKSSFRILGKPMNKKKYVHPDVTVKEMVEFNG